MGSYLYDLTVKLDVSGFITCMDMFGDQCCLFHFDGRYLLPVMPRTVRKMLKRIDNRNKLQDEKNRM